MIWNDEMETMARPALEQLQGERLAALTHIVYERVPYYRARLDAAGVRPAQVTSLDALDRLPLTDKSALREHYPFALFAVPMSQVIRLHASSGTTGKPTVVGYTRADIEMWAELCARSLALSGALPGDIFQNAYGYGLFTGGLGMHYGAEKMGLVTIPVSGGNTARQILLLQDFGSQVMACTPSYALVLADRLAAEGIDPADLAVNKFVLGAEPWTEEMRVEIEWGLEADAVNIYGLSEIVGPGVANECVEEKDGMHLMEDHFLPEILDPVTGSPRPDGTVGELVLTTLTKEAIPLIRYRTGDLCSINRVPCACGRTSARISRIVGRTDDMLIVRGVNLFPTQIEAAIVGVERLSAHYSLLLRREQRLDEIEVRPEVNAAFYEAVGPEAFAAHPTRPDERMRALELAVAARLQEAIGLRCAVTLIAPGHAPRSEGGKLQRVEDRRA